MPKSEHSQSTRSPAKAPRRPAPYHRNLAPRMPPTRYAQPRGPWIYKTYAMKNYKLAASDLTAIDPIRAARNPFGGGDIQVFNECDVAALAENIRNRALQLPNSQSSTSSASSSSSVETLAVKNGPRIMRSTAMRNYNLKSVQMDRIKPISIEINPHGGKHPMRYYNRVDVEDLANMIHDAAAAGPIVPNPVDEYPDEDEPDYDVGCEDEEEEEPDYNDEPEFEDERAFEDERVFEDEAEIDDKAALDRAIALSLALAYEEEDIKVKPEREDNDIKGEATDFDFKPEGGDIDFKPKLEGDADVDRKTDIVFKQSQEDIHNDLNYKQEDNDDDDIKKEDNDDDDIKKEDIGIKQEVKVDIDLT